MKRNNWLAPFYKIRQQVLLFGIVMSTIPLILLSVYYFIHLKEEVEAQIKERQTLKTESMSTRMTLDMKEIVNRLTLLATAQNVSEQPGLFYDLLKQSESVAEIVRFDSEGRIINKYSRFALNEWREDDIWPSQEMMQALQQRQGEVHEDVTLNRYGQPVMKWAVPVYSPDGKELKGGIGIVLQLQKMVGEISAQHLSNGEQAFVLDQNGEVIAHQSDSDQNRLQHWDSNGNLGTRQKLEGLNVDLVMIQPKAEAFATIYETVQRGGAAVLIVILLVSCISVYAGLYFTEPIEVLQKAMRRLKVGEWPQQVHIGRSDEFGELALAFNEMNLELKTNAERLLQEKERLNIIVSSIGAGLAIVKENYRVTWMNEKLKGWMHGELHMPCYTLFNERETPCPECPAFGPQGNGEVDQLMTKVQPNGEKRIFRRRLYPLKHTLDSERETLVVIEDITKQRHMEEKLIQTDKLSALGLMASNFAHEVNNPLAAIKGYAEDLVDRLEDEGITFYNSGEIKDYVHVIKDNTERCKEITQHLLNFARKSEWKEEQFEVEQVIQDSKAMLHYALTARKVVLEIKVEPHLPPMTGDPFKLMQVLVNLMNNALDEMETTGGTLQVSACREGEAIVLRVSDTGPGIPEAYRDKLFDPFFTTKPAGRGTGLGLSVCYGIVQQFGGTIHVASELGRGTTIEVILPIFA